MDARAVLADGGNLIDARKQDRAVPTFGQAADALVETMKPQWRNEKHQATWARSLEVYCREIRNVPIDQITTDHVLTVLKPMWAEKPETARRLRGRIERVLDAEKALGHRLGETQRSGVGI